MRLHVALPVSTFAMNDLRFDHGQIDFFVYLTPLQGWIALLECTDRYTRWPKLFQFLMSGLKRWINILQNDECRWMVVSPPSQSTAVNNFSPAYCLTLIISRVRSGCASMLNNRFPAKISLPTKGDCQISREHRLVKMVTHGPAWYQNLPKDRYLMFRSRACVRTAFRCELLAI